MPSVAAVSGPVPSGVSLEDMDKLRRGEQFCEAFLVACPKFCAEKTLSLVANQCYLTGRVIHADCMCEGKSGGTACKPQQFFDEVKGKTQVPFPDLKRVSDQ